MQTLTLCICEKNDAFAHFAETSRMRRMAQRMITASRHSSAECANGAWRGLFLCPDHVWSLSFLSCQTLENDELLLILLCFYPSNILSFLHEVWLFIDTVIYREPYRFVLCPFL
jgi:hypothetical protein